MISQLRKEELLTASPNLILIPPKIENIPSTHMSPHFSAGRIGWLVWFISKTGRKDWEVRCKPSVVHVDSCCPPPPLQQGSFTPSPTPAPSGCGNPPGSLPLWVQPTPSVDGRAEISPTPIQPGPPEPWKTSQGDTGLCCGPSSSSEVVAVVEAGVAVAVVLGVAVVVASFAPAFLALRTDRGRLILEGPRGSWHCCPPRRLGGMGNSRAAAWHPVPQASPQPRVFLFFSRVEAQVSKARLLFLTAQEKEAGSLFIEFPELRETPLFRSLSASQRDTHSLCIWPWEASRNSEQTPPGSFRPQLYDESFQNPNRCCPAPSKAGRVGSLSSGPERGGSVRAALRAPAVVQLQGEWPVGRKHRVMARGVTSVSYLWQEGINPCCHPSPTPKYCLRWHSKAPEFTGYNMPTYSITDQRLQTSGPYASQSPQTCFACAL